MIPDVIHRRVSLLIALLALVVAAILETDNPATETAQQEATAQALESPAPPETNTVVASAHFEKADNPRVSDSDVARWINDASGEDPEARAAAIDALTRAPVEQAIPVLRKVIDAGVDADRQLAINSLHTLALKQGDTDGAIRSALRLVIYDGDDVIASGAQVALDDLEHNLGEVVSAPVL